MPMRGQRGMTVRQIREVLLRSGDPDRIPEFTAWIDRDGDGDYYEDVYFVVVSANEQSSGSYVFELESIWHSASEEAR
jgi:murein L,D-transpeptidase YcbB/YkuD